MLTLRFKGREEKVDMTFKPEYLNQVDLYNLVLVCIALDASSAMEKEI
jgi:hypothetical protein